MTDPTQPTGASAIPSMTDDTDPLQVNSVIMEAFQVVTGETVAEQEEGRSVEALAQSYEAHVTHYTETFAQTWDETDSEVS